MRRSRLLAASLLALGFAVGWLSYRRRAARHRERVDLYAEDGSLVSIANGAPDAARLLGLARELIRLGG
jgi:hypothetical protein